MKVIIITLISITIVIGFVFLPKTRTEGSVLLSSGDFLDSYNKSGKAMLIDVRTPEEFNGGHIAGAVNIDFRNPDFKNQVAALPKDMEYYIYCHSGNRSGQAAKVISGLGVKNIFELRGGISSNPNLLTR